ncbi:family 16 glycoside hydrolase [Bythopirellula polymerisocia]|uniref:Cytochrome c n=1 Tax=Bythopirellula polymerisocia TaxID=2528003 RepID=A0A5C6CZ84_9BACT|nr:family 16 glycoside hydrolase [Bythopirellula polymerisocia]TWU28326.1 Cytochrome c [Bythopirellula polymerisocia]
MIFGKRTNSWACSVLLIASCHAIPLRGAEEQSLFDGQDLEGWSGNEKVWSVIDGQIVGSTVDNPVAANTFLVWQGGEVGDFRLTYKARLKGDNNSGVQYRSTLADPKTWKVIGYQADMHANPEYLAMLYSEGTGRGIVATRGQKVVVDEETGQLKVVGKTTDPTPVDISQWHDYEIIARGNHLIHKVDGKVTVDVTDNHKKKLDRGIIALQVHAGPPMTVFFKDILLEKLENVADENSAEETTDQGVQDLDHDTPPEIESIANGFQVEKVFEVPPSMGSWVSLTKDDRGRLIASDQQDAGLFLITPGKPGTSEQAQVQKLPVELSGAQGLVWAFDALYAVVNGSSGYGLHRLTDSDSDGLIDYDEYLLKIPGKGEHGPHAVVLSPDGRSLYLACGNHTMVPPEIVDSRMPMNWGEDLLLPRQLDARGHAAGILAPGGWICQLDQEGKNAEIVSSGYRNEYDIAFNADGELFAYDADMEWDLGMPWYRPTRLVHATSGSEFGWRSGTGKWPAYYEDSLPPIVDLGPGSPTGIVFGYGAKFPAKYQEALYLLDWTFGTIYAVHLTPDGASYRGQPEEFITGRPLPVTDAVVGTDGAMYFTVGGRGVQSALYRVTYVGDEQTTPVSARDASGSDLRALRHKLEAMHGNSGGDLELIFANLDNPDRFIRYAARIALESQPVETWRERALSQSDPRTAITALMALARQGEPSDEAPTLAALDQIDLGALSELDQLALLRTYALVFIRLGEPDEKTRQGLIDKWSPLYPAPVSKDRLNRELVQLLVYLGDSSVVSKTLDLMEQCGPEPIPEWATLIQRNETYGEPIQAMMDDMTPLRAIHYAFVLRNVKSDWTLQQRRKYFQFFSEAAKHLGGASYTGFLNNIRDEALANCSPPEQVALEAIVEQPLSGETFQSTSPVGPGHPWTKAEALAVLSGDLKRRDKERGRNLFHATSCAKCHRFRGEGGAIGPDLSTVANKYSLSDLLDSLLEPSKVISDQYGSQRVQTADGLLVTGRVIEFEDAYHVFTEDPDAPPTIIKREEVEEIVPSNISQMPVGLIDPLNKEELKDLVAYLMSVGK